MTTPRPQWHYGNHPPACTCASCVARRHGPRTNRQVWRGRDITPGSCPGTGARASLSSCKTRRQGNDGLPVPVGIDSWRCRCMVVERQRPWVLRPNYRNGATGRHGCRTGTIINTCSGSDAAISGTGGHTRRFTHSPRRRGRIGQLGGRSRGHPTHLNKAYHSGAGD